MSIMRIIATHITLIMLYIIIVILIIFFALVRG